MGRRDHDSVGETGLATAVVSKNGERNGRGWSIFIAFCDHNFDLVGGQYFQCTGKSRYRERVGIHPEKQRAIDLMLFSVKANGLTDGKDVPFVKSFIEGRTAMPGGAERNPLPRDRRIRGFRIICCDEFGHIDQ